MKKALIITMILSTIISGQVFAFSEKSLEGFSNIASTEALNVEEYIFRANDTSIKMNDKASNVLKSLGKEKQYFESQSCAFQGLDKVYTYNSFEVTTYSMNNVDYIESVFLLDDTVKTPEGVALFQTVDAMKKAYGSNYEEVHGIYTYKKGKSKLSFMVKENKIIQIEYKAIVK